MKKKQLLGILLAGTMMVGAAVPVFAADGDRVKITYAQWGNETETAATHNIINLRKKWKGICSQVPFIVLKYRQGCI